MTDSRPTSTRRRALKYAGVTGFSGVAGLTGLSLTSQPALAISEPVRLPTGLTEGSVDVSSYEIQYAELDTSSDITITYILQTASDTLTEAHTVSITDSTGAVMTGPHSISVPAGEVTLEVQLEHPSVGTVSTQESTQTTVLSSVSDINISQEEDGGITEWTGDTSHFSVVSSPTEGSSSYAIETSTDSTERYLQKTFEQGAYSRFSFYIYPQGENSEVIIYNTNTGEPLFCIYSSGNKSTLNYSDPADNEDNNLSGDDLVGGSRQNGLTIRDASSQYYHIEVVPDYESETCDIYVDGTQELSNATFSSSAGLPDSCILTHNQWEAETGQVVDTIRALS